MEKRKRSLRAPTKGTHVVDFRANTSNIRMLVPTSIESFTYNLACTQCGHVTENVRIPNETVTNENQNGQEFNYLVTCSECNRENKINLIDYDLSRSFANYADWNPLITFECKQCRIDIVNCEMWKIISEGNIEYSWDGKEDFFEFDEKLEKPIGVSEIDFNVRNK